MRHRINQPLSTDCAPIAPDHVRRGPGLIEKNQLASIQLGLALAPCLTRSGDIRARLFGGMDGLFLCVRRNCAKVLDIRPWLALVMCSSASHWRNSSSVASGVAKTRAAMASCRLSSLNGTWQRCGRAETSPVSRRLLRTLDTNDTLTSSCAATYPTA